MAEGGEGEDEIQFLRTVSAPFRGTSASELQLNADSSCGGGLMHDDSCVSEEVAAGCALRPAATAHL